MTLQPRDAQLEHSLASDVAFALLPLRAIVATLSELEFLDELGDGSSPSVTSAALLLPPMLTPVANADGPSSGVEGVPDDELGAFAGTGEWPAAIQSVQVNLASCGTAS